MQSCSRKGEIATGGSDVLRRRLMLAITCWLFHNSTESVTENVDETHHKPPPRASSGFILHLFHPYLFRTGAFAPVIGV